MCGHKRAQTLPRNFRRNRSRGRANRKPFCRPHNPPQSWPALRRPQGIILFPAEGLALDLLVGEIGLCRASFTWQALQSAAKSYSGFKSLAGKTLWLLFALCGKASSFFFSPKTKKPRQ
jgi:hypothetical protein